MYIYLLSFSLEDERGAKLIQLKSLLFQLRELHYTYMPQFTYCKYCTIAIRKMKIYCRVYLSSGPLDLVAVYKAQSIKKWKLSSLQVKIFPFPAYLLKNEGTVEDRAVFICT